MQEKYLAAIIQPLLTHPESVVIEQSNDDMGVLLTLTVDKSDMGSIIGRGGETAKCIRHMLRIAGLKSGARVSLKITEPDGSPYTPKRILGEVSDAELIA